MTFFSLRRLSAALASLCLLALFERPALADGRFTISPDGQEVVDTTTSLTWQRCPVGMQWDGKVCSGTATKFKIADAKAMVAALDKSSGKSWRLPEKDELVALLVKGKKRPLIDDTAFPGTPSAPFWALRPKFTDNLNVYMVSFRDGKVLGNSGETKFYVRLVRSN